MGLRGPGAKPVRKRETNTANPVRKRKPWLKKGLGKADRVIGFIETLKITSGSHAGKPFKLRDWQKDFIRAAFTPGVRTAVLSIPRKNGKSQLAAACALAAMLPDVAGEARGQVYSAAVDRNQAALIYREILAFIEADPELEERFIVRDFDKTITDDVSGSVYKALSADARSKHGFSASFIVADEVAQWPKRELWDVLTTSTAAREEPLTLAISTMSTDPHNVFSELVDYGRQVAAGILEDESFHCTIYEAPADADPWDEATWHAANPALNDFRSLAEMRVSARQAQRIPQRQSAFMNLYLNMRVSADDRWIPAPDWDTCNGAFDLSELRGQVAYGGLDLGSTRDLTSLALWFPDARVLASWSWIPEDNIEERVSRDRVPYDVWVREKVIETTPGRAVNRRHLAMRVAEIVSGFDVVKIGYDRWRIEDLQAACCDEGIDLPLAPFGQGFKDMSPAVEAFEAMVLAGDMKHGGNPVLAWALSNVALDTDPAGSRKPSKERSIDRIDPIAAALMAIGVWSKDPKPVEMDFSDMLFRF